MVSSEVLVHLIDLGEQRQKGHAITGEVAPCANKGRSVAFENASNDNRWMRWVIGFRYEYDDRLGNAVREANELAAFEALGAWALTVHREEIRDFLRRLRRATMRPILSEDVAACR